MTNKMNWLSIPGKIGEDEGLYLRELAIRKNVLEVGSLMGRSTICMAQVAKVVYAVDPHPKGNLDFWPEQKGKSTLVELWRNIEEMGVASRVMICVTGTRYLWEPKKPWADLAFIDGLHDYESVAQDIQFADKCLRKHGVLACHDHTQRFPGVLRAVKELQGWRIVKQVRGLVSLVRTAA